MVIGQGSVETCVASEDDNEACSGVANVIVISSQIGIRTEEYLP